MIGLFNLLAYKKVLVHLPQLRLYNSWRMVVCVQLLNGLHQMLFCQTSNDARENIMLNLFTFNSNSFYKCGHYFFLPYIFFVASLHLACSREFAHRALLMCLEGFSYANLTIQDEVVFIIRHIWVRAGLDGYERLVHLELTCIYFDYRKYLRNIGECC